MSGGFLKTEEMLDKKENFQRIIKDISNNDIVLYMKGSNAFPKCGYSAAMIDILDGFGIPYKSVDVLEDEKLSRELKDFADCPSTPQLYVKGEFVGCCDKIRDMYFSGQLEEIFRDKKLIA